MQQQIPLQLHEKQQQHMQQYQHITCSSNKSTQGISSNSGYLCDSYGIEQQEQQQQMSHITITGNTKCSNMQRQQHMQYQLCSFSCLVTMVVNHVNLMLLVVHFRCNARGQCCRLYRCLATKSMSCCAYMAVASKASALLC